MTISIPLGRSDYAMSRKVMSTEDAVQEFSPALRTDLRTEDFHGTLKRLGDLTSFRISIFGTDDSHGIVKTIMEAASENLALMRKITRA